VFCSKAVLTIFVLALFTLLFKNVTIVPVAQAQAAPLADGAVVPFDLMTLNGNPFARAQILTKNPRLPMDN
jgi:hypothetical protein